MTRGDKMNNQRTPSALKTMKTMRAIVLCSSLLLSGSGLGWPGLPGLPGFGGLDGLEGLSAKPFSACGPLMAFKLDSGNCIADGNEPFRSDAWYACMRSKGWQVPECEHPSLNAPLSLSPRLRAWERYPGEGVGQESRRAGLQGGWVKDCPKLGGRYLDKGNHIGFDGTVGPTISLTHLLTGTNAEGDVVTVVYSADENLVVESWKGTEKVSSLNRPAFDPFKRSKDARRGDVTTSWADPYQCDSGGIILRMVGYVSALTDGSLVVKVMTRDGPNWYRFPSAP